jgi:hypothetical protein
MDNTALDLLRDAIPDYARDLKLNLGSVLSTAVLHLVEDAEYQPMPARRQLC